MDAHHRFRLTPEPNGLLFECEDGCGRRLVIDRASGRMTVIDRGDLFASHRGGHSDVDLFAPDVLPG